MRYFAGMATKKPSTSALTPAERKTLSRILAKARLAKARKAKKAARQ
jgi:hypothetical protein